MTRNCALLFTFAFTLIFSLSSFAADEQSASPAAQAITAALAPENGSSHAKSGTRSKKKKRTAGKKAPRKRNKSHARATGAKGADGIAASATGRISLEELTDILKSSRNLSGRDLTGLRLTGMDLSRCNLRGSKLASADLERADLGEANLERVDLSKANLRMVNLRLAGMQGANLDGAVLDGAIWQDGRICAGNSRGECRDPLAPLQSR